MKQNILSWIEKNKGKLGIGDSYDVNDVSSGESNFVIHISGDKEIIVRANKKSANNSISREAKMLQFLEKEGVRAPKLLLYDPNSVHGELISAQGCVGDKDLDTSKMTKKQINSLVNLFADIHSISVTKYNSFFKEKQPKSFTVHELFTRLASGNADFERAKKISGTENKDLREILKKRDEFVEKCSKVKKSVKLTLIHKDPHGDNFRVKGDNVYLVDWEDADIHYGLCDVVQFLGFSNFPANLHDSFKQKYEKRAGMKIDSEIFKAIYYLMLINSLCWNFRKIEEEKAKRDGNPKKYEKNYSKNLKKLKQVSLAKY